jgi:hypothetical protein
MHKIKQILKRQSELAKKVASGKATDAEKEQLNKLGEIVDALTDPSKVDVGKTKLTTMTLAEFKAYAEKEEAESYEDPSRLALLEQNIASVKEQGKTGADDHVAVKVSVQVKESDRLAAVEEKLDEVLTALKGANFDGRTSTGVNTDGESDSDSEGEGEGEGEDVDKGEDKPAATALAVEALDTIISRFEALKTKITGGSDISKDEFYEIWPSYEIREIVEGAVDVLSKMEIAKALIEEVKPFLEKMVKDSGEGDTDGDTDGDPEGDSSDGDSDGDSSEGEETEKGAKKGSLLLSGGDMAPPLSDKEAHTAMKNGSKKTKLFS